MAEGLQPNCRATSESESPWSQYSRTRSASGISELLRPPLPIVDKVWNMRSNDDSIYTQAHSRTRAHVGDCKKLLKIRLRRTGAKKQPSYRVVVAESTAPRDGTFLENLGYYNPLTSPTTFVIKEDRVKDWLDRGAQPTDRVARLLSSRGIVPAPTYVETAKPAAAPAAPASA